jgi:hypothetical protein
MAIGVLLDDEQHSFMLGLESFFWARTLGQLTSNVGIMRAMEN